MTVVKISFYGPKTMSITRLREPNEYNYCAVLLSDATLTHPRFPQQFYDAKYMLAKSGVGTILSMTSGEITNIDHLNMYSELNIFYAQIPIHDDELMAVRETLQEDVLKVYDEHCQRNTQQRRKRAILVNCSAGVNRSALAAAIILWHTTPHRPWQTSKQLIEEMRARQLRDRNLPLLLVNRRFYAYLIDNLK